VLEITYNRKNLGRRSEDIATKFLKERGYKILERNFRWRGGEVDIIAMDGDVVVFVEVRSLEEGLINPIETIGPKKREKIIRGATLYLLKNNLLGNIDCRFDVIGVKWGKRGLEIEHIKDAFRIT
jgi:putative endonuclease